MWYTSSFSGVTPAIWDFTTEQQPKIWEKWVIFPQGPPRRKMVILQKCKKHCATSIYVRVRYCTKSVQNFRKNFRTKYDTFHPGCPGRNTYPFLVVIPDTWCQTPKNKPKFVKTGYIFPMGSPRKKLGIFAKTIKIVHNIKLRTVSLFCKKRVKFAKSLLWQMWTIFNLVWHVIHTPPFLGITPVCWGFTTKKQSKIDDTLSKFLPGGPRGNSYFFWKLYSNIKYQG